MMSTMRAFPRWIAMGALLLVGCPRERSAAGPVPQPLARPAAPALAPAFPVAPAPPVPAPPPFDAPPPREPVATVMTAELWTCVVRNSGAVDCYRPDLPKVTRVSGVTHARAMAGEYILEKDGHVSRLKFEGTGLVAETIDGIEGVEALTATTEIEHSIGCFCTKRGAVSCADKSTVARVPGVFDARELKSYLDVMCVVRASGAVGCFRATELHEGMELGPLVPIARFTDATEIVAVGPGHVCFKRKSGIVECASYDYVSTSSPLPNTSYLERLLLAEPRLHFGAPKPEPLLSTGVKQVLSTGVKQVRLGVELGCAMFEDGTVKCARTVACETSTTTCWADAIMAAPPLAKLHDAVQLSVGDAHACALRRQGGVVCWGTNERNELDLPSKEYALHQWKMTHAGRASYVPNAVVGLNDVARLVSAEEGFCAIRRDETVWCWGRKILGRFPKALNVPTQIPGLAGAIDVASAEGTVCAVTKSGTASCVEEGPPVVMPVPNAVAIRAIAPLFFAQTRGFEVYRWGGPLTYAFNHVPGVVAELERDAGSAVSPGVSLVPGVSLLAQIGVNCVLDAVPGTPDCNIFSHLLGNFHDVVAVAGTCLLRQNGIVECRAPEATRKSGVRAIDGHFADFCALLEDGAIDCWGWHVSPVTEPIRDATQVAVSGRSACALRKDATVSCWGEIALGDGSIIWQDDPFATRGF